MNWKNVQKVLYKFDGYGGLAGMFYFGAKDHTELFTLSAIICTYGILASKIFDSNERISELEKRLERL